MEIYKTNSLDWHPSDSGYTVNGLFIPASMMPSVLSYSGLPETLHRIDSKYKTHTSLDVLQKIEATPEFLVDNNEIVSVIDPKSCYCFNDDYYELISKFETILGIKGSTISRKSSQLRTEFTLSDSENNFFNDIFDKKIIIDRLPQGGVLFTIGLLRLVCTNGMMVPDSQYKSLVRSLPNDYQPIVFTDLANHFDVNSYFTSLFTKNGVPLMASVADYLGMMDNLSKLTDSDTASYFFPLEPIERHYSAQGIDIEHLSRSSLSKLPSGVTYYNAFNILTNGIKLVNDISIKDELEVSKWIVPSKLSSMKLTDISYQGVPKFDEVLLHSLMGDIKS